MSPSDTLRALLDERGIEHKDNDTPINGVTSYMTTWHCDNGNLVSFIETEMPHATKLRIYNPTPEQAIAATVGAGMCHAVVCNQSDCVHNCEYRCACTDLEIQDQECLTYRCVDIDYDEEEE